MTWLFARRLGRRQGAAEFAVAAFTFNLLQAEFYLRAYHRLLAEPQIDPSFLLPPPGPLNTVGGYVQWAGYGALAALIAGWAVVSASGTVRGDEQRGLVASMLTSGVSRADLLFWRFLAFAGWAVVAAGAAGLGYASGAASGHSPVDVGGVLGASLALAALGIAIYSLTVLVAQVLPGRSAVAVSGTIVLALFLLDRLAPLIDGFARWRWLSPFHYFDAVTPLATGGSFDVRAVEVLIVMAAGCGFLALLAFTYRDIGDSLWRPPLRFGSWLELLGWTAGMIAVALVLFEATRRLVGAGLGIPPLIGTDYYFQFHATALEDLWLLVAQLLVAVFAMTQVSRWVDEATTGRLQLVLASPVSRTRVALQRGAMLALTTLAVVAPAGLAIVVSARFGDVGISAVDVIAATLLLVPLATAVAGVGAVLAAWVPRAGAGVLAVMLLATYALPTVAAVLGWPAWTLDAALFHLYGHPLTQGVDRTGLAAMLTITVVGFAASAFLLNRRDLGR